MNNQENEEKQLNVDLKNKSAFREGFEKKLGETAAGCFSTIIIFLIIMLLFAFIMANN